MSVSGVAAVHMVVKGKGTYAARGCELGARPVNSDSVPTVFRPDPTGRNRGQRRREGGIFPTLFRLWSDPDPTVFGSVRTGLDHTMIRPHGRAQHIHGETRRALSHHRMRRAQLREIDFSFISVCGSYVHSLDPFGRFCFKILLTNPALKVRG